MHWVSITVSVIFVHRRHTLERTFAELKHKTREDITSSKKRQHSILRLDVVPERERQWTDPARRLVEQVNRAISRLLNLGDTQVEGLCPGSQEAFLKSIGCAVELDLGLGDLAGLLVGRPISSLAIFATVVSRCEIIVCATSTESAGSFTANDAGVC